MEPNAAYGISLMLKMFSTPKFPSAPAGGFF
jgi:hypothetical protein